MFDIFAVRYNGVEPTLCNHILIILCGWMLGASCKFVKDWSDQNATFLVACMAQLYYRKPRNYRWGLIFVGKHHPQRLNKLAKICSDKKFCYMVIGVDYLDLRKFSP